MIDKVTGKAVFSGDFSVDGALHLKFRFANTPHGRIKSINTKPAQSVAGVHAVFTAKDIPVNKYGLMTEDQPVLCDQFVRFVGDQIAVVAAETPQIATLAASLIEIEIEDLPIISAPEQALKGNASRLHENYPNNIAHQISLIKGDPIEALARADLVLEDVYITPMQEHAFLEPEAGLAFLDEDGRVVIRTAGQSVFDDQRQIAAALDLPPEMIRVVYGPVGGAFGGREDLSVQILLALAAWKLKRPIKAVWSREESICGHAKRHAMTIKHRWGVNNDGTIIAAEVEILVDAGAYMYTSASVLECLHSACVGPYEIPNISLSGKAVFTNNIPGGAFRGYGAPQTAFAAESHISQLAEKLGIDPITIRSINCLKDHSTLPTGTPLSGRSSFPDLIQACAEAVGCNQKNFGWSIPSYPERAGKAKGVGFSLGLKATGYGYGYPEGSYAKVTLYGSSNPDRAEVFSSAADVGQGADIALAQIAANELDLPIDKIQMIFSDTALSRDSGATAASRITYCVGNAILLAAEKSKAAWNDEYRPAVGEGNWTAPQTTYPDPRTGACIDNISYSYAALAAVVEVDPETGEVRIEEIYIAQDVGKKINQTKIEGQIQGAVLQATGWALLEDFQIEGGKIITGNLNTYLIPTARDIPESIHTILVENPDPNGPYGLRGVGEIPFVPVAPAIADAIYRACGKRIKSLPIKAENLIFD